MRTEYVVLLATVFFALLGWGIRAFWLFTKELAEWRVKIFDSENGLIVNHAKLERRVDVIERRLGWDGEFYGRRSTDIPNPT